MQRWSSLQEREELAGSVGCWTSLGGDLWPWCQQPEHLRAVAVSGR